MFALFSSNLYSARFTPLGASTMKVPLCFLITLAYRLIFSISALRCAGSITLAVKYPEVSGTLYFAIRSPSVPFSSSVASTSTNVSKE